MPPDLPIYIVDDDLDVCRSLSLLLKVEGYAALTFLKPEAFMAEVETLPIGIIISDVCMPVIDGMMLANFWKQRGRQDPIILITGHADVPMTIEAIHSQVFDFIQKPFSSSAIVAAIERAREYLESTGIGEATVKVGKLSKREREVLHGLVKGETNKQIAIDLGISPRTVEIYRANLMHKMGAKTLSGLIQMGVEAGLVRTGPAQPVLTLSA